MRASWGLKAYKESSAFFAPCLQPSAHGRCVEVLEAEDADMLQNLVHALREPLKDPVARSMQDELRGTASRQLPRAQNKQKFETLASLFGLEEERRPDFVAEVTPKTLDAKGVAEVIYRLGGRRCVPQHILNALTGSARQEIARAATEVCEAFARYTECRLPRQNAPNFSSARARGCDILAHREVGELCYFLLRDADRIMRETAPTYFELVQAIPCQLQTELSPEAAFDELDKLRGPNYAFVGQMWEKEGRVHASLNVWNDKLEIIPLPSFRLLQMAVVTHPKARLEREAFPVSLREVPRSAKWVFLINSH